MKRPNARETDIVVQKLGKETLVYNLNDNKAFCLNETSALVWEFSDGKRTVTEISDVMSKSQKTQIGEDFVYLALDQLGRNGLLEDEIENDFIAFSRREVIRRVGFASAVALPIVSAVIAPKASMAQSGGGMLLGQCTGTDGTQGSCNTGLTCRSTRTAIPIGGGGNQQFATGIMQCCIGDTPFVAPTTFCRSTCASGSPNPCCNSGGYVPAAPDPNCTNIGQLTCACP